MNFKKITALLLVAIFLLTSVFTIAYAQEVGVYSGKFAASGSDAFSLAVYGDYCYVSARNGGMQIFDISDIENIKNITVDDSILKKAMPTDGAENVAVYDGKLYAAFGDGVYKFSLEDPSHPTVLATDASRPSAMDFAFYEDIMFAVQNGTLKFYTISGDELVFKGDVRIDSSLGRCRGICVYGSDLYVGMQKGYMIYDITSKDLNSLTVKSSGALDGAIDLQYIAVNDDAAYFLNRTSTQMYIIDKRGILDLSDIDSGNIVKIDNVSGAKQVRSGMLFDNLFLVGTGSEVRIYDVSDADAPVNITNITTGDTVGQCRVGDTVYIAVRGSGIMALDLSSFSYLNVKEIYQSFPAALSGMAKGSSEYSLYADGNKMYSGVTDNGSFGQTIFDLSNGSHKIGYSKEDGSVIYYDTTVNTQRPVTIAAADGTGERLNADSNPSDVKFVEVTNNTGERIDGTLICAFYTGGKMLFEQNAISLEPYSANEIHAVNVNGTDNIGSDGAFKSFLLKSFDEPVLLSGAMCIGNDTVSYYESDDDTDDVSVDIETVDYVSKKITISLDKKALYSPETAIISLKPNAAGFEDLDYADVMDLSKGAGRFTYYFDTAAEKIPFSVRSVSNGFLTPTVSDSKTFVYLGTAAIDEKLAALEATSGLGTQSTENYLRDNSDLFGIDISPEGKYGSLADGYKQEILKAMAVRFSSVTEVKTAFNKLVDEAELLTQINTSSKENLGTVMENSKLQQSLGIKPIYNAMTKNGKEEMLDDLGKRIADGDIFFKRKAFSEYFNPKSALIMLNTTGYLNMGSALKLLNDEGEANFDLSGDYSTLENSEEQLVYVHKILERTDFSSVGDAESTFETAVSEAVKNKSKDSQSSSATGRKPGSGGGGGGSIGSVSVPPSNTTIDTTPINSDSSGFSDISGSHWAAEAVKFLSGKGIVSGYPDGTFKPDNSITREEFSKLICTAVNIAPDSTDSGFFDVLPTDWYCGYVTALKNSGIINGVSENAFGVGTNLTRQDMAVIVMRLADKYNVKYVEDTAPVFIDFNDVSDYARTAVRRASIAGIMTGDDTNRFSPADSVTRAMAAKVIYNFISLTADIQQ